MHDFLTLVTPVFWHQQTLHHHDYKHQNLVVRTSLVALEQLLNYLPLLSIPKANPSDLNVITIGRYLTPSCTSRLIPGRTQIENYRSLYSESKLETGSRTGRKTMNKFELFVGKDNTWLNHLVHGRS